MIRKSIILFLGQTWIKKGVTVVTFDDIINAVYDGYHTDSGAQMVRNEIDSMGLTVMDCHGCDASGVYINSRELIPWLVNIIEEKIG